MGGAAVLGQVEEAVLLMLTHPEAYDRIAKALPPPPPSPRPASRILPAGPRTARAGPRTARAGPRTARLPRLVRPCTASRVGMLTGAAKHAAWRGELGRAMDAAGRRPRRQSAEAAPDGP